MGFKKIQISAQNSKRLAFGFNEKHQFAVNTDRNSTFLGRKAHILDRLHTMVPYRIFTGLKKFQILAQNPKGGSIRFYQKHKFTVKSDRKSVFRGCKTHISDQLHIIVQYISFYVFYRISNFGSKFKGGSLRFYEKMPACGKN
jgi:hypothetical protein